MQSYHFAGNGAKSSGKPSFGKVVLKLTDQCVHVRFGMHDAPNRFPQTTESRARDTARPRQTPLTGHQFTESDVYGILDVTRPRTPTSTALRSGSLRTRVLRIAVEVAHVPITIVSSPERNIRVLRQSATSNCSDYRFALPQ